MVLKVPDSVYSVLLETTQEEDNVPTVRKGNFYGHCNGLNRTRDGLTDKYFKLDRGGPVDNRPSIN